MPHVLGPQFEQPFHPHTFGWFLTGTAIMIANWRAFIGLALFAAAIVRKLTIEERFLAEHSGDNNPGYCAEVSALTPFIV